MGRVVELGNNVPECNNIWQFDLDNHYDNLLSSFKQDSGELLYLLNKT